MQSDDVLNRRDLAEHLRRIGFEQSVATLNKLLTEAERRGYERGWAEEREWAVGVCKQVERTAKRHRDKSAPGTVTHYTEQGVLLGSRTCAIRIRDAIATPGTDTESSHGE